MPKGDSKPHAKIRAMNGTQSIAENLARIRERIERAASRVGRPAEEITLVAVSKTHAAERIREAYRVGVRHFGENRVQEWESKFASLSDLDATWHLIGHLQSNKATRAARLFHSIDAVDALALAERLERAKKEFTTEGTEGTEKKTAVGESLVATGNLRLRVLIEVKLDPGPTKSGVGEDQVARLAEAVLRLPHLELCGLMGVPPYIEDAENVRPYFRRLRELRDKLRTQFGAGTLPVLSTGMSHDFEVAIEEGATEIRVGTALFGARQKD
jgi:pyridoxal phosphate enzyme (YggS family)